MYVTFLYVGGFLYAEDSVKCEASIRSWEGTQLILILLFKKCVERVRIQCRKKYEKGLVLVG